MGARGSLPAAGRLTQTMRLTYLGSHGPLVVKYRARFVTAGRAETTETATLQL